MSHQERFDFDEFDQLCAEAIDSAEQSQSEAKLCLRSIARLFNTDQMIIPGLEPPEVDGKVLQFPQPSTDLPPAIA